MNSRQLAGEEGGWGPRLGGGLVGAHDLEQGHDVGGREEVRAHYALGRASLGAYQRNVDGGRVGRQDGVRAAHALQVREYALLQAHVLDHRFDHLHLAQSVLLRSREF